jgi:prevent-host-death family protein
MSYMAKGSVSMRELQQNLKRVIARVEKGETVDVTRRRRPVARLAPAKATRPLSGWPDLQARTHSVFGDRVISRGGSDVVIEGRGER